MASLLSMVLVLGLAGYCHSCCTPDQWEGIEGSVGGYSGRHKSGGMHDKACVHYDFKNKRMAKFVDYVVKDYENKFHIVVRHEKEDCDCSVMYIVDLKKGKCWKKKTHRPMREACIPKDAKDLGEYYLGLEGGFKVHSYLVHKGPIFASVTVSDIDAKKGLCAPVGEILSGKMRGVGFLQNVGFVNITPGIKNETVFDVPKECNEEVDFSLAAELERDHFILGI